MSRRKDIGQKEIVIPVMGATGAGKSTFINTLLKENRNKVGRKLTSCTRDLAVNAIDSFGGHPTLQNYRLLIVDTPGFDDTRQEDTEILRRIAEWLKKSYKDGVLLGGVIYLHDVTSDRFTGTARTNLEMFQLMCGEEALPKVVLGTTKWKTLRDPAVAPRHENELKVDHWSSLIQKGSIVLRFEDSYESAKSCVDVILRKVVRDTLLETALLIQTELVEQNKSIPETAAGKSLKYTLQELLQVQKQIFQDVSKVSTDDAAAAATLETLRQKMDGLTRQVQDLKIPFGRRFRLFFGLG